MAESSPVAARSVASLSDVNRSVAVPRSTSALRRLLAFCGPGYLIAVGYMDPGNWATSLAGGAAYGYALLFVILLSSVMAVILQSFALRLGIATGRDLAQACRHSFSRPVSYFLWALAEIAICATDVAEVIGTAIALDLLFDVPLSIGVIITALDVFLLLGLQRLGFRKLEAFVISLLGIIGLCYAYDIMLAQPVWGEVLRGFVPTRHIIADRNMLYLAIGILGATVMPHNLYLHSAIVQTRRYGTNIAGKREAIKFATIDSTLALVFAFFINAAILILAASVFHAAGRTDVSDISQAYHLLSPLLGTRAAALAFGVALLACGLNSTATATLAGQVVMEGFLNLRLKPWARRLLTRLIAIVPALWVTLQFGGNGTTTLLVLSQVILSLQLPFAVVPLLMFVSNQRQMQELALPLYLRIAGIIIAAIIISLNIVMLLSLLTD